MGLGGAGSAQLPCGCGPVRVGEPGSRHRRPLIFSSVAATAIILQHGLSRWQVCTFTGMKLFTRKPSDLRLVRRLPLPDRLALSMKDDTPVRMLDLLARDRDAEVRLHVAEHPGASFDTLARFVHDHDWSVRWAAAGNPVADRSLLVCFANDRDPRVVASAARNPNASKQLLCVLSAHKDPWVRLAVAESPFANDDDLVFLGRDEDKTVSEAAKSNLAGRSTASSKEGR